MEKCGSIALYGSPVYERRTVPWSVQLPGSMVLDVTSPMAEFCEPKVETE